MNKIKIAACYIRVSTDDQAEYSPSSQLRVIREYAKNHDFIIPDSYIFVDEGISGRTVKKRPQFNEMIATAKTKPKPFDAVLLWKFSRFARNRADAIVYKKLLRDECGIDVISISESLGEDKGTALILESMLEAMDEYYSINLSTEVKRSMTMKAENGEVLSIAPFGYRVENKKFVIVPEKAEIIKFIYNEYESGTGKVAIAKKLTNMGIKTNRGNFPDNRFVTYILKNPVYCGKIRWSKEGRKSNTLYRNIQENDDSVIISQGSHEPIIDEEQFQRVQKLLKEQSLNYRKYQRTDVPTQFALKGLVCCSNCGATLVHASAKNPSVQCHNYSRGSCKISHHIAISKLNNAVSEALRAAISNMDFDIIPLSNPTKDDDVKVFEQLIISEKRKFDKIKEAYEAGIDTISEYRESKKRITKTISKLETELKSLKKATDVNKKEYANKIANVLLIFETPTISEEAKNKALRSIVHKIIFNKAERSVNIIFYT